MAQRPSLSEAKRRATREHIERAAAELAVQSGHENVTVEAICAAAGVSRSTFFNHCTSREAAIFGRGYIAPPVEEAVAILDAAAPDLLLGIFRLAVSAVEDGALNGPTERARAELYLTQPTALRHLAGAIAEAQAQLTLVVDGWLAAHPEHCRLASDRHADEAAYAVGVAITAALRISPSWLDAVGPVAFEEATFRASLADLRAVIGEV